MTHEPECTQKKQTTWALDGCQVCVAIRAAYKRGRLDAARLLDDAFKNNKPVPKDPMFINGFNIAAWLATDALLGGEEA